MVRLANLLHMNALFITTINGSGSALDKAANFSCLFDANDVSTTRNRNSSTALNSLEALTVRKGVATTKLKILYKHVWLVSRF